MTHAHAQKLGIEQPFPQAPRKPAKHEVRFYVDDQFRGLKLFGANYSAMKYLEVFMDGDPFKKINPTTMIFETAQIHSPTLEEILEHRESAAESQFELSTMTVNEARHIRGLPNSNAPLDNEPKRKKNKNRTSQRRAKKPDGLMSISDIAKELDVHPRNLRKILRDNQTPKPEHGWAWQPKEAKKITKKLKKAIEKG